MVYKAFVQPGGVHVFDRKFEFNGYKIKPMKTYLKEDILKESLTIIFCKNEKEEILYYKDKNIVFYNVSLKSINN